MILPVVGRSSSPTIRLDVSYQGEHLLRVRLARHAVQDRDGSSLHARSDDGHLVREIEERELLDRMNPPAGFEN